MYDVYLQQLLHLSSNKSLLHEIPTHIVQEGFWSVLSLYYRSLFCVFLLLLLLMLCLFFIVSGVVLAPVALIAGCSGECTR